MVDTGTDLEVNSITFLQTLFEFTDSLLLSMKEMFVSVMNFVRRKVAMTNLNVGQRCRSG